MEETEKLNKVVANPVAGQDVVPEEVTAAEDPGPGEDGREDEDVVEGVEGDIEEEVVVENLFLKGYANSKNPGKLVVGSRQRFTAYANMQTDEGHRYYYQCARKLENRGNKAAMCKATVIVDKDEQGDLHLQTIPKLEDHNHACDESRVIKWKIMEEMEESFIEDVTVLPSKIRKKTILKYQIKYRTSPDIWQEVLALLPSDESIDKRLREIRMKTLGKLPKSRNDLNLESLLENLKEWGGDNVKVLDSNLMWEDEAFRAIFSDVEGFSTDSAPERVILFSTDALLSQLAQSTKWSQVRNPLNFQICFSPSQMRI